MTLFTQSVYSILHLQARSNRTLESCVIKFSLRLIRVSFVYENILTARDLEIHFTDDLRNFPRE